MRRRARSKTWMLAIVVIAVTLAILHLLGVNIGMPIAIILGIVTVLAARQIRQRRPGKAAMFFTIAATLFIAVFSWPIAVIVGAWEFARGVKRLMGGWVAVAFMAAAIGLVAALFLPPGSWILLPIRKIVMLVLTVFGTKVFLVRTYQLVQDFRGKPAKKAFVPAGYLTVALFGLALAILAYLDFSGMANILGWAVVILEYLGGWLAMPNNGVALLVAIAVVLIAAAIWLFGKLVVLVGELGQAIAAKVAALRP